MPAPPGVLQAQYAAYLYSTAGNLVYVFSGWQSLTYSRKVNDVGTFSLTAAEPSQVGVPLDAVPPLMVEDALLVVRRRIPDAGVDWYTDFTGLCRAVLFDTDEAGNLTVSARGVGTLDLLARRVIAYPAGTKQVEKYGATSSQIYEYAVENAGISATTVNGRYAAGTTAGLTIPVPAAFGPTWQGAKHMQNLLAVIQEISVQTAAAAEFYMDTTVGSGSVAFALQIVPRVGTDRSASVTFSKPFGNVGAPKSSNDWSQAKNRVYVLGPGEKADRVVITANSATRQANSPWAITEKTREATQQSTGASLSNLGAAELEISRPIVAYSFTPIETAATRYGIQYFLGDTVTAVTDDGTSLTLRIIGVTVTNNGGTDGSEKLSLDVSVLR